MLVFVVVAGFRNFIRMEPARFYDLLQNRVRRCPSHCATMLQRNATHSLMYSFREVHDTFSKIVLEVSSANVAELVVEVISCSTTPQEWQVIAGVFAAKWQFFHALGALDGKYVHIRCPAKRECVCVCVCGGGGGGGGVIVLQLQGFSLNNFDGPCQRTA